MPRMFTSRAEFRLSLRADNADQRLTPLGIDIGSVSETRKSAFLDKMAKIAESSDLLNSFSITPNQAERSGLKMKKDGVRRTAMDLLSLQDVSKNDLESIWPSIDQITDDIFGQMQRDARYAPYIKRQMLEIDALKRDEALNIPLELSYALVPGLSSELVEKLEKVRPSTIAQAGRIEGMTPAALAVILVRIKQSSDRHVG